MDPADVAPPQAPERTVDGVGIARRVLVSVGVLALIGTALGLLLVNRLGTTYRDGLEVARDGAGVGALSTASAEQLAADVAALVDTTSTSLDQAVELLETAAVSTGDVGVALGTNLSTAIEGTEGIANGLAGFIEAVERFIPGDSDSLAEDLRAIADGLEPVPEQLRTLGEQLATVSTDLSDATTTVQAAADQLDDLATSIADARASLAEIEGLTVDVADRADAALERSSTDLWLVRLLVVVIGLGVVGVCYAGERSLGVRTPPETPPAP